MQHILQQLLFAAEGSFAAYELEQAEKDHKQGPSP
ncbi:hypothetical protein ALCH109712_15170 [Alkalicoccus chagannorensis]